MNFGWQMKRALFVVIFQVFSLWAEPKVALVVADPFIKNAIVNRLQMEGMGEIRDYSPELAIDFTDFMPDYVIIDGSTKSAADSMIIDAKALAASYAVRAKKTLLLSSSEVYPERAAIPLREDILADIELDELKNPYQIAKLSCLKQCRDYNGLKNPRFILCPYALLAGAHATGFDQFSTDPIKNISARILKAKAENRDFALVSNDGKASYEVIHVDDLASAVVFLLTQQDLEDDVINIGYGRDTNIKLLAEYIRHHLKFEQKIIYDVTSFDDIPRRVLDTKRLTALGWYPSWNTQDLLKDTVLWLEKEHKIACKKSRDSKFTLP